MKKRIIYFVILLFAIGILAGCGGDSEPTSPGGSSPKRHVVTWVNAEWSIGPKSYKCTSRQFSANDTLNINITLKHGDYIKSLFFVNEADFQRWENGEIIYPIWGRNDFKGTDSWVVKVPTTDRYYFVMYNDAIWVTIKADLRLDVIWWK